MTDDERTPQVRDEKKGSYLILPDGLPLEKALEHPQLPDLFGVTLKNTIWQWRNEITIGRSVMSTNLLPPWVAALLAWGAEVSFQGDEKTTSLATFLEHAASHPGKVKALRIPLEVPGRVWGRDQVARTPSDNPIVSVTSVLDLEGNVVQEAKIALTGVWERQARLADAAKHLRGRPLEDDVIQETAAAIQDEVTPRSDFLGSAAYRREMAGLLTRRSLLVCREKGA
ncbi:MAG: hypothetical protein R6U57_00765 [Anaerolineales bacterium]